MSCSRRTWNLFGQRLAYPFPRSIPSYDSDSQAAVRSREARHGACATPKTVIEIPPCADRVEVSGQADRLSSQRFELDDTFDFAFTKTELKLETTGDGAGSAGLTGCERRKKPLARPFFLLSHLSGPRRYRPIGLLTLNVTSVHWPTSSGRPPA
jgi:hypothetical protein